MIEEGEDIMIRGPMFDYNIPKRCYHRPLIVASIIFINFTVSAYITMQIMSVAPLPKILFIFFYILFLPSVIEITLIFMLRFYGDRLPIYTLGFQTTFPLTKYIEGLLIGLLFITVVVISGIVSGGLEIGFNNEMSLKMVGSILLMLVGFIFQGASEEICIRGYMLQVVATKKGCLIGTVLSAIFFSVLHSTNPGITGLAYINLFLFSCFGATMVIYRGEVITICGFHTAWNWCQGHLYGLLVSGNKFEGGSLFETSGVAGKDFISGGTFGVEGSLVASVVFMIGIGYYLYKIRVRGYNCTKIE